MKNKCIYCKSTSYGKICPFSPHKIHVHMGDPNRCIYCGSTATGQNCPFNPHGKVHIHGIEFNSMVKETIETGITMGYLKSMLSKPITEMQAYKLGIINSNGKRLKTPQTAEEQSAYGPLEEYIIGIKQATGGQLQLVNQSMDVKLESVISNDEYARIYEDSLKIKEKFFQAGELFKEAVANAYHSGISTAAMEKLIIDSILENE